VVSGPFSTDGARTPAPQTNAKYVGRLLARCATPTAYAVEKYEND
jgi:hypothetical protein